MQRVSRARVSVRDEIVSQIGPGLCLLVGIAADDAPRDVPAAVDKIANLRVFSDGDGRMNRSVIETGGEVLVVSQFTLLGDVRKGRRPSFTAAARPEDADPLVREMVGAFRDLGIQTSEGVFGALMEVELVNDGPVTVILEVSDGHFV